MILAGIDEAGYGPLLGPMVVGCCAFDIPDADPRAPLPCLWKRLKKHVSRNRLRSGRKIHVNDSKAVYSPSLGLKELERSVLSLASAWNSEACGGFEQFLGCVAEHVVGDVPQYAWYAPAPGSEVFPVTVDGVTAKLFGNALRVEMERTRTPIVHLAARVVLERQFNRMLEQTRNKAATLFSVSAIHLDALLRAYGERGLVVFFDRQGGRGHYGSLLRLMFEEWHLETTSETDGRAEYWMARGPHRARVIFCEKAEAQCMPVAIASMLSKYLRELLMHRFNAFWRQHVPDLLPTAGYYGDGERFLRDIAPKRAELGVRDEELVRCR